MMRPRSLILTAAHVCLAVDQTPKAIVNQGPATTPLKLPDGWQNGIIGSPAVGGLAVNQEPTTTLADTLAPWRLDNKEPTTTPVKWWNSNSVQKGIVGSAAVAGLAAFGGLGAAAIMQAQKRTTTLLSFPPPPSSSSIPGFAISPVSAVVAGGSSTPAYIATNPVTSTTPSMKLRIGKNNDDAGSSINPFWLGVLVFVGLVVCCCIAAFCWHMCLQHGGKRSLSRPSSLELRDLETSDLEETIPLTSAERQFDTSTQDELGSEVLQPDLGLFSLPPLFAKAKSNSPSVVSMYMPVNSMPMLAYTMAGSAYSMPMASLGPSYRLTGSTYSSHFT